MHKTITELTLGRNRLELLDQMLKAAYDTLEEWSKGSEQDG